ncbi:hypothetical protein RclHR1_00200038 [Rhizophagus clarus]|uniref:F-box domain-containing protein n=1 Tax=Rhizophagus clarus TaxID=94130 RepID=A0A2Z6QSP3_9GLOM|nr:hypothetical protein RclHR1_00200038 [Rhizophagus clarus]GES99467.1 hypothetical protein GLOIN_2v1546922 [Rhizophagus clarus]
MRYFLNIIVSLLNKPEKVILPTLPPEIMQQILKYVQETSSLHSSLLVNRYWCQNVVPLLWNNPFKQLPKRNSHRLIRTYLLCLNKEENFLLDFNLKPYLNVMNLIPRRTLFEYPFFLNEISFKDLERVVSSTILKWCDRETKQEHKPIMAQIVISILFQLFTRMSSNLRSIILNNGFDTPELINLTNFNLLLSQLRKLKVLFTPLSQNIIQPLDIISSNCKDLRCLDFRLSSLNYTPEFIQLISTIIKSQNYISEFTIANISNGSDPIFSSLHSHKKSLKSLKIIHTQLTEPSINIINQFNKLHTLTLCFCGGLSISIMKCNFPLLRNLHLSYLYYSSDITTKFIEKYGKSLNQIGFNFTDFEVISSNDNKILSLCPNITELSVSFYAKQATLDHDFVENEMIKWKQKIDELYSLRKLNIFSLDNSKESYYY